MILTLDQIGQLVVTTSTGSIPIKVECLDDIHRVIEKYQIDYISPEVTEAHRYTNDQHLLAILGEFHMQRACVIAAAALLKTLPKA